ncbi:MAG: hypothetical protein WCJ19_02530 [bacterium]
MNRYLLLIQQFIKDPIVISENSVSEVLARVYPVRNYIKRKIPYFSQWESKEAAEFFVKNQISLNQDPSWRKSGARNINEYEAWAPHLSAIACLKMILALKYSKPFQSLSLAKECKKYGGYIIKFGEISKIQSKGFCKYVKKKFRLYALPANFLSLQRILFELNRSHFVMAEVSPEIRNVNGNKKNEEKQMVLIVGYNKLNHSLFIHNPSGFYKTSQEYFEIKFNDFNKFFNNKGIIIKEDWLFHALKMVKGS